MNDTWHPALIICSYLLTFYVILVPFTVLKDRREKAGGVITATEIGAAWMLALLAPVTVPLLLLSLVAWFAFCLVVTLPAIGKFLVLESRRYRKSIFERLYALGKEEP